MPKISIVIPNYNHAVWLEQAIESALSQTSAPDEVLILDDGSQDHSPEILKKYQGQKNVRVIFGAENKGTNYRINEGLQLAKGDFVLFLAADDFLHPTLVADYRSFLNKYSDIGFCCSLSATLLESGEIQLPHIASGIPSGYIDPHRAKALIYKYSIWPWFFGNTMLLNKEKVMAMGGFNPTLESYADAFLYIQLALRHGLVFIPDTLATYRKRAASYSSRVVKDIHKLTLIENRVVSFMETCPEYFDKAFINRWQNRWKSLKYIHHCLGGNRGVGIKFIYVVLIFLRYRWFDIRGLTGRTFQSFFREATVKKVS